MSILLPIIVLAIVLVAGSIWYRRAMTRLRTSTEQRTVKGSRLTAEHLRRLTSPPWRVVFEIGDDRLGDVDHVAIGPPGIVAIITVVIDRPTEEIAADATLVAAAAVARGGVDDLAGRAGLGCHVLAKVFWGTPHPDAPAGLEVAHGSVAVEGQRLGVWLTSLPDDRLSPAQVDLAWQAIVTGIGRPDPLG